MRFDEAFREMVDNAKSISRKSWPVGCLLYDKITKEIEYDDGHSLQRWCPSHGDVIATDWRLI